MQNIYKGRLCPAFLFKSTIFTIFLLCSGQQLLFAQCDEGAPTCFSSEEVGFPLNSSMIQGLNNSGDIPGCDMGSFHNTTWYQIIPTTSTIGINISASNCTTVGINTGFQAGLYEDCNPNSANVGDVQCQCTTDVTLSGGVTPGEVYYLMIDGCGGSACDLSMTLTEGSVQAPPAPMLGTPNTPAATTTTPCPGAEVTFSVAEVQDGDFYTWNFPPDVTIINADDCGMITVEWGETDWNVTVTANNIASNTSNESPSIQIISTPPATQTHEGSYCTPGPGQNSYTWWGTPGVTYTDGTYDVISPGPICDTPYVLTVVENRVDEPTIITQPTTCNSSQFDYTPNGQATLFISPNGFGPYSYDWPGSSVTGPTNNELPPGISSVTITDTNTGCQRVVDVFIDEPLFLDITAFTFANPSCDNASDGSVGTTVTGGTEPYTYSWFASGVGDGDFRDEMSAGIYEVTVTDGNGCTNFFINELQAAGGAVSATESNQSPETCVGADNGAVTLTGNGPGTFTFTWPDGNMDATRNDLAAGDYEVTIADGSGCSTIQTITIAAGSSFTVDPPAVTNVQCFGESNGSVTVTVAGATAPVSYDLGSGTVTGNVISGLPTGNYNLTVTDGAGCSNEIPVFVDTPAEFTPTIANTPVSCGGSSDGTATVTPNGGTAPYMYSWADGETTPGLDNLPGGTYSVTVTDANMCSVPLTTEVDGGGSLVLTQNSDPALTRLEVSCVDATDGQITVDVGGATGMVTYSWVGTTSNTGTATGLAPGSYTLNVEDGAGCTGSFPVTITAPDPIVVMETASSPTSCAGETDGSAEVSVSGGTGTDYTFLWDNGETVNPAVNLGPGTHTVTVEDENNCPQTQTVTIAEPVVISAVVTPAGESCAGEDDGTITVDAMGGSGTYSYDIGNGSQPDNVFTNVAPGDYTVVVTNSNGSCAQSFPVSVMGQMAITAVITPMDVSCAGAGDGQAVVVPDGGAGSYTFLWSDDNATEDDRIIAQDGGGYSVTVTDANGCSEIFTTVIPEPTAITIDLDGKTAASCDGTTGGTASITAGGGSGDYSYTWSAGTNDGNGEASDLPPGMVTVIVEDGNGCSTQPFPITIDAPAPVTLMEDQLTPETCFNSENGAVTVTTNGGTLPFTFNLNGDVATNQNSNEFTDLAPGNYTVNVTDLNGCEGSVNITIPAANPISGAVVDANSELDVCNGMMNGSVTIDASGGAGDLSFQLDNGAVQTSNVFEDLTNGNYTVTVIDENNCSIEVPFQVNELPEIALNIDTDNSLLTVCDAAENGSVIINASGGNNTFMFTLDSDTQTSNEFTDLAGGSYTVTVTDGNNCTSEIDFTVDELTPIMIDIDDDMSDLIVCSGSGDGSAIITATGGGNNLTYSIPGQPSNNDGVFNDLSDGSYTVTVTDDNLCSNTFDFTVALAPAITAEINEMDSQLSICDGDTDGSVTIAAGGGDGAYRFTLGSDTQDSPSFENLPANTYQVIVTDGNGCTETVDFTIAAAAPIDAIITASDLEVCNGASDGSVTITASGGNNDFTFNIDGNDQTDNVFNNLAPGPHTIMVRDGNDCAAAPINFTVTEGAIIDAGIDVNANNRLQICDGALDGSVTITASGGIGNLRFSIDGTNFQDSNEFVGLGEGNYSITVRDENECTSMAVPVSIAAAPPVTGTINAASVTSICNGETVGSIIVDGAGGNGMLTYTLNPGNISQTTNEFNNLPAGNYTIDIEDENNCTSAGAIPAQIIEADPLTASFDPGSDLTNCFGATDGSVTINAGGGSGGFMYDIGAGPQQNPTFDGLAPGTYFITVTDMNNCVAPMPVEVTIMETPLLELTLTEASSDLTVCSGVADAFAAFEATGGNGDYSYSIDGNPAQPGNTFNNLAEGPHSVMVVDGNNCEQSIPFMVEAAPAIVYNPIITNVDCFGEAEGQIEIDVTGGQGPFDFVWSDAQVTETAQFLTAGSHTVTITDVNMCEVIETFMISQPAAALVIDDAAVNIEPATCGETNGSVSISVAGGVGPYTYQWSDNMTTDQDLTAVGPGSYTVTVTDANMCIAVSENYSVNEPGALGATHVFDPVRCNGESSGGITLNVTGGTMPYTFAWSDDPAETSADRDMLSAGTYSVTVSDNSGCILPEINITVTEPQPLMGTLTPTQANCGTADGSVSLVVSGGSGVGTYTYAWSNGTSDPNLSGVTAGTYDVTVTDENMCEFISMTTEVTNPGTPSLTISGTDVTCFGESTGTITLGITGGSGGNMITWNVPALNGVANPTNLPAGDYFVTVTDMSMCEAMEMFTITEPASAVVIDNDAAVIQSATCGNTNGSVSISVAGGVGPYTYQWSDNMTTDQDLTDVGPGSYTVTVTDANMCTAVSDNYSVSEPGALEVTPNTTPVVCNGESSGGINLVVEGGTDPYTFAWSDDAGETTGVRDMLPQGTYTVTVSDASGCILPELNITVSEPDPLTGTLTPAQASCGAADGSVGLSVSGGTGTYTYAWSNGTSDPNLSGVAAGIYDVTITDENMCQFISTTTEVTNPGTPSLTISGTDVDCFGESTGTITLGITDGSGGNTITWNVPALNGETNPANLPAGDYFVTVTDMSMCAATEMFTITEPASAVEIDNAATMIEPATCGETNGSVSISVFGGVPPYTYQWSNMTNGEDISGVGPGSYTVTVTDANMCTAISNPYTVNEPGALEVTPNTTPVVCNGESSGGITLDVTGGTMPYTFAWSDDPAEITGDRDMLPGGTYTVTVSDGSGCVLPEINITVDESAPIMITGTSEDAVCGESNGSINITVTGGDGNYTYVWDNGAAPVEDPGSLPAGQYNVTVTDGNNCVADPFNIAVTSPNAPQLEFASTDITCNGANDGTIDLTVSGGTGDVTITWVNSTIQGNSADNLPPGVYEIIAEDAAGCTFPVNITIDEPVLLEAFVVDPQSSTLCNGSADGSIELTVQGGTGAYDYEWTNGAGNVQNPNNLLAGLYEVIVTDENGCTATESVTIAEPDAIELMADASPASCSNTSDGGVQISVNGGTGDYMYDWDNGSTEQNLEDLQPGAYTLIVSDQNGCNGAIDVIIEAPAPIAVNLNDVSDFSGFNTSCSESEDGFITVSAAGGNGGYAYAWADGTNGPTISDIGQGSYNVIVTDQEGCTGENNFLLDGPAPIVVDVETDEPDCFGETNGVVIINGVEGGQLPYRFSLNNGDYTTAQFFGNLGSGTYSLVVEDANGCTSDTDVVVDEVEELTVSLSDDPVINITLGDSITLSPQTRITLDSNFVWSGGASDTLDGTLLVDRPFNTTAYSISVTDEFGCTATDEVLVQVTKPRAVYIPNAFNPDSDNGNERWMISGSQDVAGVRRLEIYNRWGDIIFSDGNYLLSDMPGRGSWDGTFRSREAQTGVYIYIIEVEFIDGHSEMYSGDITLLR